MLLCELLELLLALLAPPLRGELEGVSRAQRADAVDDEDLRGRVHVPQRLVDDQNDRLRLRRLRRRLPSEHRERGGGAARGGRVSRRRTASTCEEGQ